MDRWEILAWNEGRVPGHGVTPAQDETPPLSIPAGWGSRPVPVGTAGLSPCREEPVQRFTGRTDPVEVLRTLRSKRDNFKKPKERPNPQAMLAFEWGLFGPFLEKK